MSKTPKNYIVGLYLESECYSPHKKSHDDFTDAFEAQHVYFYFHTYPAALQFVRAFDTVTNKGRNLTIYWYAAPDGKFAWEPGEPPPELVESYRDADGTFLALMVKDNIRKKKLGISMHEFFDNNYYADTMTFPPLAAEHQP